jgi:hypothetical protein
MKKFPSFCALPMLAVIVACTTGSALAAANPNPKILKFCQSNIGKKVGDGECATLVLKAFEDAGAKRYAPYAANADYVWGKLIGEMWVDGNLGGESWTSGFGGVKAGDVIQFRNAQFSGRSASGGTYTRTASHHSAVVTRVSGNTYHVLHCNINGDRKVQEGNYNMNDLKRGHVWFYRPQTK